MDFHPTAGRPMSDAEAAAEAKRIMDASFRTEEPPVRHFPTSFRDDSPVPAYGDTPPVHQPDHRIVPAWAAGIAVASIGVGAGITGIGCGAWLVLQGLASVSLAGVLMVTLPFAGLAMAVTAIGGAVSRTRSAVTKNIYEGPVTMRTEINNHTSTRGMFFARTRNDIHN
ncbi:hypothetical protein [Streptomyces sp. SPB4]|uniref:hypothetical protein n=1 Tax=Streptomyces TaxID=1883 RepID=UPI002476DA86|nr:hypothetical protein [Streptomyces sp. SPB4]MDH6544000.1 hypothetical protein [Streptomyces sp. SPB4]